MKFRFHKQINKQIKHKFERYVNRTTHLNFVRFKLKKIAIIS